MAVEADDLTLLYTMEFIGTFFLVFFGSGSMAAADMAYVDFPNKEDKDIGIALVHMITYSIFTYAASNKAKCTFNPVISLVKIIRGRFSVKTVMLADPGLHHHRPAVRRQHARRAAAQAPHPVHQPNRE